MTRPAAAVRHRVVPLLVMVGVLLLGEHLSPLQWFAILLVVFASVGAALGSKTPAVQEPAPL